MLVFRTSLNEVVRVSTKVVLARGGTAPYVWPTIPFRQRHTRRKPGPQSHGSSLPSATPRPNHAKVTEDRKILPRTLVGPTT